MPNIGILEYIRVTLLRSTLGRIEMFERMTTNDIDEPLRGNKCNKNT